MGEKYKNGVETAGLGFTELQHPLAHGRSWQAHGGSTAGPLNHSGNGFHQNDYVQPQRPLIDIL